MPAAPALVYIAVALTALLAWIVLYGLKLTIVHWLGSFLRWVSINTPSLPIIGNPFGTAANFVQHRVAQDLALATLAAEQAVAWAVKGMEQLVRMVADAIADLAHATEQAVANLASATIPNRIQAAILPLIHKIAVAEHRLVSAEADILRRAGHALDALASAQPAILRHAEHTAYVDLQHAERRIAGVTDALGDQVAEIVGYTRRNLAIRLRKVEALVGVTAVAATVIGVLEAELPWFRCGNVGKVAKRLCNLPTQILDDLLAVGLDIFVLSNLCTIIGLMLDAAQEIVPALDALIGVENALVGCHGAEVPPEPPAVALFAPPLQTDFLIAA